MLKTSGRSLPPLTTRSKRTRVFSLSTPTIHSSPHAMIQRRCSCGGNCPGCQYPNRIQTKLETRSFGDTYEQEADRVAQRVMRQEQPANSNTDHLPVTRAVTVTNLSMGKPLPENLRSFFEPRFGQDFGHVRIHDGEQAAASAANIHAKAYTYGQHIVFNKDEYKPDSNAGRTLLAHELTHVVQQGTGSRAASNDTVSRAVDDDTYGHKNSCSQSFLEQYVWPGHALAKKMVHHGVRSLCGAYYGNDNVRNRKAIAMLKTYFGNDWRSKAKIIYDNFWRLRVAFAGNHMYDCVHGLKEGCDENSYAFVERRWIDDAPVDSDINLCVDKLIEDGANDPLPLFARTVIHEIGHLRLNLDHGEDDISGVCNGSASDAHCYGLLAENFWLRVQPEYGHPGAGLCMEKEDFRRDPSIWDE